MTLVPTVPRSAVRTAHRADREDELTAYYYFELRPRVLTVEAVHPLSATLVRVRFSADDGFSGFPSIGAEDHLKLFFDHDPSGEPVLPVMRDGRWSPRGRDASRSSPREVIPRASCKSPRETGPGQP